MSTALWPLQVAIVTKLHADPVLDGLVSGVYDHVPEGTAYPYVTVGSITELPDDAHNQRGLATRVVLHTWAEYRGNKQTAEILAALDAVLDRQPLAVPGWTDISIAAEQHQTVKDPDPTIRHINSRYRVWLTKEA
ncbi:DUF3168 domain-containing protein [Streptomyces sp. CNQ085]|uniref:DUF3168 domain-containing protein n=1 Tax=Streptomyces sp. CNQ085 TaxID=2886944 RepID=UPI001F5077BA|nr:DUF3168 domain-containing protein [Streptomyces sp. CNQ085]MCI0384589.1 DUF3168 domain-containing protein [Streptomyces sp. CNQ085]